jgi:hypothetical protein
MVGKNNGSFHPPVNCALCDKGPYSSHGSLFQHVSNSHPSLSVRERSNVMHLSEREWIFKNRGENNAEISVEG